MRIPSMVRAVVFDIDRTLLDHDRAVQGAVRDWLTAIGVPVDDIPGLSLLWQEAGARQSARFRSGELSYHQHRRERVREVMVAMGWRYTPRKADSLFRTYLSGYARHWVAYDDAAPLMRTLREGGRLVAVLTNGDIVQQRAKLRCIGLLDLCDEIFASSHLPAGKPDPRAFKAVTAHRRLEPTECLMVGDDLETDVAGAINAGWHAVHVDRTGHGSSTGTAAQTGVTGTVTGAHRIQALADLSA